ncbi:MAG: ATP-binding protein [Pseudomonadota bacterium]
MGRNDPPGADSLADSQTIRLDGLFTRDVTSTGSFDIRGEIWASTFGKVLQAMPVPVLLIDKFGEVITANEAWSTISPDYEKMVGAPFSELFPDTATREHAQALLRQVFSTRKAGAGETIMRIGNSSIRARTTYRPIRIVELRLVLLVVEDLTREMQQLAENVRLRQELEIRVEQRTADLRKSNELLRRAVEEEKRTEEALNRSEELFRLVFNTMSSGVLVIGPCGEIQLANRSALFFLGLDGTIIGRTLKDAVPGLDISGIERGAREPTEAVITLPDGSTRLFGLTAAGFESENRMVIVFRDITTAVESRERKRRADELALVGEMISRLSHEIKNPLAGIVVGLGTLHRGARLSPEYHRILQLISQEVDSLTKTVNRVLDAARPRVPSPRPVYVEPLMERCMDANSLLAVRRGVTLELVRASASSAVVVDDQAVLSVLGNLVQNALDACSKGDRIRIGWREPDAAEKAGLVPGFSGKVVVLFVEDTGSGIADELSIHQSRVFKAFVSTKVSSSGLGLTVARDIVESHGGVIMVDSCSGLGTRVDILLPSLRATACWDWRNYPSRESPSTKYDDCGECDVVSSGSGYCCWTLRGRAHHAETGRWPEDCFNCGFFRSSSLTPFFKSRLINRGRE